MYRAQVLGLTWAVPPVQPLPLYLDYTGNSFVFLPRGTVAVAGPHPKRYYVGTMIKAVPV